MHASSEAKLFTYSDEFIQSSTKIIFLVCFQHWNKGSLLDLSPSKVEERISLFVQEFLMSPSPETEFFSSFLHASLIYVEVRFVEEGRRREEKVNFP